MAPKNNIQTINLTRRVTSGSFWAVFGVVLRAGIGLISVPLTLTYLGTDRLGLWRVAISIVALTAFLKGGLLPHIKTNMAEAYAENNFVKFKGYASTSLFLAACFIAIGGIGSLFVPLFDLQSLFNIEDPVAIREAVPLMMTVIFLTMVGFASTFIVIIYDARLEVSRPRIYTNIAITSGFILLLVGIKLKVSLPVLVFLSQSPIAFVGIFLLYHIIKEYPELIHLKNLILPDILKKLSRPAVMCMGISLSEIIMTSAPNVIIARNLSLADVSIYSIGYQLMSYPLLFLSAIMPIFWPALTIAWAKQKYIRIYKLMSSFLLITAVSLLLFSLFMFFYGDFIINIWTGGTINLSKLLIISIGIAVAVQGCTYWITTFMWSTNELTTLLWSSTFGAVLNVVVSLLLVQQYGTIGVVIGIIAGSTLAILIPVTWRMFSKINKMKNLQLKVNQP